MLYREIIAVCSEIHTKHTNTQCGQNVVFVNDKRGGTYSDHWSLEGQKTFAHCQCFKVCSQHMKYDRPHIRTFCLRQVFTRHVTTGRDAKSPNTCGDYVVLVKNDPLSMYESTGRKI